MTEHEIWRIARRLFDEALELGEGEREHFVARHREIDENVGAALATLLFADQSSCELLDSSGDDRIVSYFSAAEEQSLIGRTIGAYRLVRRLGAGGMGIVFLGERTDDVFEKQVAVKLLSVRWLDSGGEARFDRERRILARLEHPGIARILDGGSTESGLPYLVMEYVDGQPVTEFCEAQQLELTARLELFLKICSAVSFAHRNLVVHRDLKAGNVLVTRDGDPKLLDFGIAGLMVSREDSGVGRDALPGVALTPDYASPEQILGQETTTGSDVYSLGVLLYQLLTGRLPWRRTRESLRALRESLDDERFVSPSVLAASADGRQRSGPISARRLAGDLDAIVLRSLERDTELRYSTVRELAADIDRFLAGQPVSAREGGATYRFAKAVGRHPRATAAAAAGLGALLIFSGFTLLQAHRLAAEKRIVEHERRVSEGVSQFLIDAFEWADPSRSAGAEVSAGEILSYSSQRVAVELTDDAALRGALLARLGSVHRSLGSYDEGAELLAEAVSLQLEHVSASEPALLGAQMELARIELARGDSRAARRIVGEVLTATEETDAITKGEALHVMGQVAKAEGEIDQALELHRRALTLQATGDASDALIRGLMMYSRALQDADQREAAESPLLEALGHQQRLHPGNHPLTARALRDLAILAYRGGDYERALTLAQDALEMYQVLFGSQHPGTGQILTTVGNVYRNLGRFDEAEEHFRRSLEVKRLNLGEDHPTVAVARYNLAAFLHRERGLPAEAEPLYRSSIRAARESGAAAAHPRLNFFLIGLGDLLVEEGRSTEALTLIDQAYRAFSAQAGDQAAASWNVALARSSRAAAFVSLGRFEEAELDLLESQPLLEKRFGVEHRISHRGLLRLARLYQLTDEPQKRAEVESRVASSSGS